MFAFLGLIFKLEVVGNIKHILLTKNASYLPTRGWRDKLQTYIQRQKVTDGIKVVQAKVKEVIC